jgi:hypothetical protein
MMISINESILREALDYLEINEEPSIALGHIITFWQHRGKSCAIFTPDAHNAYVLKCYISQISYFMGYIGETKPAAGDLKILYDFCDDYTKVEPVISNETGIVALPRGKSTNCDFVKCQVDELRDYRLIVTVYHIKCSLDSDHVTQTANTYTIEFDQYNKVTIAVKRKAEVFDWMRGIKHGYDLYRNPTNLHYHAYIYPKTALHYEGINFWVCDENVVFLKYYKTWIKTTMQWMITSYKQDQLPDEVAVEWNMYDNLRLITK